MPWARNFSVAVFCTVAVIPAAQAHTWTVITKSDDGLMTFYVDRASVVTRGTMRRVQLLYDYKLVQQDTETFVEHFSTMELASVDCRDHRLAAVQSTSYAGHMGKGKIIEQSVELPEAQLRYVNAAPGSIDERVVTYVCSIAKVGSSPPAGDRRLQDPEKSGQK